MENMSSSLEQIQITLLRKSLNFFKNRKKPTSKEKERNMTQIKNAAKIKVYPASHVIPFDTCNSHAQFTPKHTILRHTSVK